MPQHRKDVWHIYWNSCLHNLSCSLLQPACNKSFYSTVHLWIQTEQVTEISWQLISVTFSVWYSDRHFVIVIDFYVEQVSRTHSSVDFSWFRTPRQSARLQGRCTLMFGCTFSSSHAPLTSRLDKDFGPLPPIVCLFLPSDFLLLDVAPFLSTGACIVKRFTFWHYLLTVSADI